MRNYLFVKVWRSLDKECSVYKNLNKVLGTRHRQVVGRTSIKFHCVILYRYHSLLFLYFVFLFSVLIYMFITKLLRKQYPLFLTQNTFAFQVQKLEKDYFKKF